MIGNFIKLGLSGAVCMAVAIAFMMPRADYTSLRTWLFGIGIVVATFLGCGILSILCTLLAGRDRWGRWREIDIDQIPPLP
jgi:hypothetical protein